MINEIEKELKVVKARAPALGWGMKRWLVCLPFFEWVRGGCSRNAPRERKRTKTRNQPLNSFNNNKRESELFFFFLERQSARNEVKCWWSGKEEKTMNGAPSASAVSSSTKTKFSFSRCARWKLVCCWRRELPNSTHPTHSKEKTKKFVFLWVVGEFSWWVD